MLFSEPTIDNDIIQSAWKDNALVLFLSTTHETGPDQIVVQHRKQPATTSMSAKTAHKLLELQVSLEFQLWVNSYRILQDPTDPMNSYGFL
jgi:hypothetical protein